MQENPEHLAAHGRRTPLPQQASDDRRDDALDPGDAHDKGELSLCVGEAA